MVTPTGFRGTPPDMIVKAWSRNATDWCISSSSAAGSGTKGGDHAAFEFFRVPRPIPLAIARRSRENAGQTIG